MTPSQTIALDAKNRQVEWEMRSTEQKISFLRSARRDAVAQLKRSVHTARAEAGLQREINRIDRQLAELEPE